MSGRDQVWIAGERNRSRSVLPARGDSCGIRNRDGPGTGRRIHRRDGESSVIAGI